MTEQLSSVLKRKRVDPPSADQPDDFWDTLSKVPLCRSALREFDRRTRTEEEQHQYAVTKRPKRGARGRGYPCTRARLQRFARRGGPDLGALRGFSDHTHETHTTSQSSAASRKRGRPSTRSSGPLSSGTGNTKSTTPYDPAFEQKLIDCGVYPDGYENAEGDIEEPSNMNTLRDILSRPRRSLSPAIFTEGDFRHFKRQCRKATSESRAMAGIIPIIAGAKDEGHEKSGDVPFNSLEKFAPDLSVPSPGICYGSRPRDIDVRVRETLSQYIVPSSRTTLPAAPNFFLEGKSMSARPDVAQRQAVYDGAVGARGILRLQEYAAATEASEAIALTISATWSNSTLTFFATHPQRSANASRTEYFVNQLRAYTMTDSPATFREGAAAFRNARDWCKEQRDRAVEHANRMASEIGSHSTSMQETETSILDHSAQTVADVDLASDTSADELAIHVVHKRRR